MVDGGYLLGIHTTPNNVVSPRKIVAEAESQRLIPRGGGEGLLTEGTHHVRIVRQRIVGTALRPGLAGAVVEPWLTCA